MFIWYSEHIFVVHTYIEQYAWNKSAWSCLTKSKNKYKYLWKYLFVCIAKLSAWSTINLYSLLFLQSIACIACLLALLFPLSLLPPSSSFGCCSAHIFCKNFPSIFNKQFNSLSKILSCISGCLGAVPYAHCLTVCVRVCVYVCVCVCVHIRATCSARWRHTDELRANASGSPGRGRAGQCWRE